VCGLHLNSDSFWFSLFMLMWFWSAMFRLFVIFSVLGAPFLAVVGYIFLWFVSMSLTFRLHSSTGLMPVSLLILSLSDSLVLALAMSMSICCVVGIFLFCVFGLYFGICHCIW